MGGFNKAQYLKGVDGSILKVNPDGSVEVNLQPLGSNVKSAAVSIAPDTPAPLPSTILSKRKSLIIYNGLSGQLYLGGSDVTDTNGLPLSQETYMVVDLGEVPIYGYAPISGTVRILEIS